MIDLLKMINMADIVTLEKVRNDKSLDGSIHKQMWQYLETHNIIDVVCANGHISTLQHEVDKDGKVTPSLECPIKERVRNGKTYPACNWHVYGLLKDYNGELK